MSQIAAVYAQALYSLASDEGLTDEILHQLKALNQAFSQEKDYVRLLSAPGLPIEERIGILDAGFRGKVQPYVLNFMKILTEKGYMRHFSACCDAYRALYNEANGILPVKAITAVTLTQGQSNRLRAKLEGMTGKRIELINVVDPACMGGVRLDYDGKRVDGTIQNRLDSIHRMLKNTVL